MAQVDIKLSKKVHRVRTDTLRYSGTQIHIDTQQTRRYSGPQIHIDTQQTHADIQVHRYTQTHNRHTKRKDTSTDMRMNTHTHTHARARACTHTMPCRKLWSCNFLSHFLQLYVRKDDTEYNKTR